MKMKSIIFCALFFTAGVVFVACTENNRNQSATEISKDSLIKRGNYLVTTIGCGDCHSPKVMTPQGPMPDTTKLLSGHRADVKLPEVNQAAVKDGWALFYGENTAVVTPLGISYAANITSDSTGIGNWSFEQFVISMTKGKYKGLEGSRNLLPPMPWQNFAHMSSDDLKAIYEYLQSTKPVNNVVPAAQVNM
jgi:hypothetical protein